MRATTTPVEENQANPCHFVIVPTEESIDDLLIMLPHFMAAQFPPVKPGEQPPKKPRARRWKHAPDTIASFESSET
jgi:hypothetical protein